MSSTSSEVTPAGFDPTELSGILRIASVIVILIAGFCGVSIPIFFHRWSSSRIFTIAKAFGAGVVLSTAYVHVFPTAQTVLKEALPSMKYPLSGLLALSATVVTLFIEQIAASFFGDAHGDHSCNQGGECTTDGATIQTPQGEVVIISCSETTEITSPHSHKHINSLKEAAEEEHHELESVGHRLHHHHQHSHEHVGVSAAGTTTAAVEETDKAAKSAIIAHILEIGISLHSVIIGLAVGASSDVSEVRALLIALSFHQFFEGIALGVSVVEAKLKRVQKIISIASFSLATPIGISIGIIICAAGTTSSNKVLLTQGVLDAISAGILVYMALVDMVSETFQSPCIGKHKKLRIGMLFATVFGAACMSLLALWA